MWSPKYRARQGYRSIDVLVDLEVRYAPLQIQLGVLLANPVGQLQEPYDVGLAFQFALLLLDLLVLIVQKSLEGRLVPAQLVNHRYCADRSPG